MALILRHVGWLSEPINRMERGSSMFKKQSLSLALAMCLSSGVGQALANEPFAQIKSIEGDAMVTQGERFITAREGMELQQLDRIVVLEQGGAMIEFQDGCQYRMQELEVLTVGSMSACKAKGSEYRKVEQTATSQIQAKSGDRNDCLDWKPSGSAADDDDPCAVWWRSGSRSGTGTGSTGTGTGSAGAGSVGTTTGAATTTTGAAGTATGTTVGAAGAAGTTGAAGGLGSTIAGLGAATGLGTAGVIGAGAVAVVGTAAAVRNSNDNNNNNDNDISPE